MVLPIEAIARLRVKAFSLVGGSQDLQRRGRQGICNIVVKNTVFGYKYGWFETRFFQKLCDFFSSRAPVWPAEAVQTASKPDLSLCLILLLSPPFHRYQFQGPFLINILYPKLHLKSAAWRTQPVIYLTKGK